MSYEFRADVVWDSLPYLLGGIYITLYVTIFSILIGLAIGLVVGVLRTSKWKVVYVPMMMYIEFFRNTPSLVKLIWVYYMIPILLGVDFSAITSSIIAMGVSAGAYLAEIFRGGIQDVDRGQIEAARSLGMTSFQTMRRIILPQAIRKMLPPFVNTFIVFLKYSSLVSVLGVADLTYRATLVSTNTFRPLELFTAIAVMYFFLCIILSQMVGILERRLAVES